MWEPPVASRMRAAFLLVASLVLAGCAGPEEPPVATPEAPTTTPAATPTPTMPAAPGQEVATFRVFPSEIAIQPGHTAAVLVEVTSATPGRANISLEAFGERSEASLALRANASAGEWVTVHVPEGTPPGVADATVRVDVGGGSASARPGTIQVRVLGEGPVVEPGDVALVYYVGRLAEDGRAFNTNEPGLEEARFPLTDSYRFSEGAFTVETSPPTVVEGFYQGLLGMQEGETRLVTFGPELGYGPATREQVQPREESIPREVTLDNAPQRVSRATYESYVNESGQGDADGPTPGDTFTLEQGANEWRYRVVHATETEVSYVLAPELGDARTLYSFWPGASVVTAIGDENVTFRTTPTTGDTPFTLHAYWPDATVVAGVNETDIRVRHSPPEGFTFVRADERGQPEEAKVVSLTEESIVLAVTDPNPLAGKSLTFHIRVAALRKA